ncbi:helix-turn-helix domain-containing protein [Mesorhizobium yinganensis]|uniref:helix-turn-helix domain-containing protein n=1 Tax=Mesorhizobium yinganensis TaxID=3157707 RepID=UPI0032B78863
MTKIMAQRSPQPNGSSAIYVDDRLICAVDVNTGQFPASEQFEVFRDAHLNVVEVDLVRSRDGSFPARQMAWDLGRLIFTSTELPGAGYAHRRRHLRRGALDHWYVSVPLRGSRRLARELKPATPSIHCLARPFEAVTDDDAFLTLFMPHDLLSSLPGLEEMVDMRVDGGCGSLMANYLLLLQRSLPELTLAEASHVFEATHHLVAACLTPSRDRFAEAQRPIDTVLLDQVRKTIALRLADRSLTPEMLCSELGLSRSRLYRLFEPLGGVSTYIRHQRLRRTRDALADSSDRRSISRIAEEWGFMDPSAYSRTFRHEFGISPSEAREEGWVGGGSLPGQHFRHSADRKLRLAHLLQALSV